MMNYDWFGVEYSPHTMPHKYLHYTEVILLSMFTVPDRKRDNINKFLEKEYITRKIGVLSISIYFGIHSHLNIAL
jgi:hypothetical protein